jgi:hypothetical protein
LIVVRTASSLRCSRSIIDRESRRQIVFESEPKVPEALFGMDQVVLQPHVGSATHETRKAMGDLTVDNLRAHFSGKPVLMPVA